MIVRDVYNDVATTMCEPDGFQLGLVDDAEFLQYYRSTFEEFMGRARLCKGVALDAQLFGEAEYQVPDWLSDIEAAFSDGGVVNRDFEESISAANRSWKTQVGTPRSWRQDKMVAKLMALYPAPVVESSQAPTPPAPPDFGIVSAYVPGGDPSSIQAFIGTLTQTMQTGVYASPGDFFGATDLLQFSRGNVMMIGSLSMFTEHISLDSPVEHLTDDWAIALKYGILKRIFGSDGETRDILRERYASARFEEMVMLAAAINGEVEEQ